MTGFIIAAVIIAGLFAVIASRPSEFKTSRTLGFAVPASAIFPHVNTLRAWEPWSPWIKMEPEAKGSLEGPESGVGARMHWEGKKIGTGSMTITQSRPYEYIGFRLDFLKPMKGTSHSEFVFKEQNGQTLVTWSMNGKNGFMAKIMSMFMDCEGMVGGQFEKGLADLKALVEKT